MTPHAKLKTERDFKNGKRKKTNNPVPPVFLLVSPTILSSSGSRSFASSPMSCACGKTHHTTYYAFESLMQPASLTSLVCHSLCHQGNSSPLIWFSISQTFMRRIYQVNSQKCSRSRELWLPGTDELLRLMLSLFSLCSSLMLSLLVCTSFAVLWL